MITKPLLSTLRFWLISILNNTTTFRERKSLKILTRNNVEKPLLSRYSIINALPPVSKSQRPVITVYYDGTVKNTLVFSFIKN